VTVAIKKFQTINQEIKMKDKKVYYTYQGIYRQSTAIYTTDKGQLYAQQELAKALKARKPYQVAIAIVERDGNPYYNSPTL
jgi:hypothetical protein